jgi:ribosomal protein S13
MNSNTSELVRLKFRPTFAATFDTIYGISRARALRLTSFLRKHPNTKQSYNNDLMRVATDPIAGKIFTSLFIDRKIRFHVASALRAKIMCFCYIAYRLFQNLPTKGQRTKANGKTPRHFNPYLSLRINPTFYKVMSTVYKRRELFDNARFDELKAYNKALQAQEELSKTTRLDARKKAKEKYYRELKATKS